MPKPYWYRQPTEITCYACRELKPADEFAIDRDKAGGRKSICRPCDRAKAAAYYARKKQVA